MKWLVQTLRGVCMGIADSIPGVSGGTMALILGIYPRLIDAIGGLGVSTLRSVLTRDFWRRWWAGLSDPEILTDEARDRDVDRLLFLAFLGAGMAAAIVLGSRVIPTLLDRYPAEMKGFFFGLVLCSVSVPMRMIGVRRWRDYVILIAAALATWLLLSGSARTDRNATGTVEVLLPEPASAGLVLDPIRFFVVAPGGDDGPDVVFAPPTPVEFEPGARSAAVPILARMAGEWGNLPAGSIVEAHGGPDGTQVVQEEATSGGRRPSQLSLFVAGFVAISAMVLPGISGSFILLLFGLYHYVTHSLRMALFQADPTAISTVATVLFAIVLGLLTITRVIKALLTRFRSPTLAALSGLMIGSLRMLWPFVEANPDGTLRNVVPASFDTAVMGVVATFLVGCALVLLLERLGEKSGGLSNAAVSQPAD